LRSVLDNNVIISAVLFEHSNPALALRKAFTEGEVLFSQATENELEKIIFQNKFDPYIIVEERTEFLQYFFKQSTKIEINQTVAACHDPKDNMILELAVCGDAGFVGF
jgi:uncharacterized protein